jgi:hypothetical protein
VLATSTISGPNYQPLHDRGGEVLQALNGLGWSHEIIASGSVRGVTDEMRALYVERMTSRVVQLMREWEKKGWLSDKAA